MSRADADARELIARFGGEGLLDPGAVARQLGVIVVEQVCEVPLNGMLLRGKDRDAIGINTLHPSTSQRFSLAHLLGHFRLHRARPLLLDTPERLTLGDYGSLPTDREEAEANRFASALLMPEEAVRNLAAEADATTSAQLVEVFTRHFGLSPAAVGHRLMSLGIILDV